MRKERESGEQSLYIFYSDFKDQLLAFARSQGIETIDWQHIIQHATQHPKTNTVLHEHNIMTSRLNTDLTFVHHFGSIFEVKRALNYAVQETIYAQAANELMSDLNDYLTAAEEMYDPDYVRALKRVRNLISNNLYRLQVKMTDGRQNEISKIKAELLSIALNEFMEQSDLDSDLSSGFENIRKLGAAKHLAEFMKHRTSQFAVAQTNPLAALDAAADSRNDLEQISPYKLVEIAIEYADSFLKYLLYRNGMLAPDGYTAQFRMPADRLIEAALQAVRFVEAERGVTILPKHLLPALILDPAVITTILELDKRFAKEDENDETKVKPEKRDFIKLGRKLTKALTQDRRNERFRNKLTVSQELIDVIKEADDLPDDNPQDLIPAYLFKQLIADPEIANLLLDVGLTERHFQAWDSALAELQEKKEVEKKEDERTNGEFKISKEQLEELIKDFTTDLTAEAKEGRLDPIIGRDEEIEKMVTILLQRGRKNPLLLGEPGVGKTKLFEGLALRVASGDVPQKLIGSRVLVLNLGEMNQNAMYRGQFEGRLLPIIQGAAERNRRANEAPIIFCIDELHASLKSGSASETPGAGELLKPYLTKGDLSVVGATTQRDYARVIQQDTALDRRFQPVFVEETNIEETALIIRGLMELFTKHHNVEVPDEVIPLIVRLTDRYILDQQQPDKSILVYDASLARAQMRGLTTVTEEIILETIAAEAQIDKGFFMEDENSRYLALMDQLPQMVIGQPEVVKIAKYLIMAKAGLNDPNKPLGSFILLGPTGVGKTETAKALARLLFGSEEALIPIHMGEMTEKHETAKLVGAPPGFVGYGEEGLLTGAVRRRPYSVVLIDEIEKADKSFERRLLSILAEGQTADGMGKIIDFRNTVILMTSNLGAKAAKGFIGSGQQESYMHALNDHFSPEFLNRLDDKLVYNTLDRETIHKLVDREIQAISDRTKEKWKASVRVTPEVEAQLGKEGYNADDNARFLKRTVNQMVSQQLSLWLLRQNRQFSDSTVLLVKKVGQEYEEFEVEMVEE